MDNFVDSYQPLPQKHNSFLAELLHTVWEPEGRKRSEKSARHSNFQLQETHAHTRTHTCTRTHSLHRRSLEVQIGDYAYHMAKLPFKNAFLTQFPNLPHYLSFSNTLSVTSNSDLPV